MDVAHGLGVVSASDAVFVEACDVELGRGRLLHRVDKGVKRAVSLGADFVFLALVNDVGVAQNALLAFRSGRALQVGFDQFLDFERACKADPFLFKDFLDFFRLKLALGLVGRVLYRRSDDRMHGLGRLDSKVAFQNKGRSALSALRVDSDDAFILAADVVRVNRKVGNIPNGVFVHLCAGGHSLADRVLVASAKGCVDKLA